MGSRQLDGDLDDLTAPLGVPLQVSTTVLQCISQFSERVLCGNALGISAVNSGYASWDKVN